ncbi:corrinoid protein [Candidatus Sordicultor fermentans]|jgi:5-methyltetrahydrofolate--homocysteine methyltransferase|uniref:corrinoid protein n=1 Tax=Candidatus Sordicultor fermentans TaxID=1953203 RepID=UPI001692B36E|nr:corrinoid protein [Atribacterota bacterium]NLY05497.1 cobalamin-binding protein [Candidatus Atribacteria bacterium]MDI9607878.1 corrinoid protein [Atribacterota bacterium]HOA98623.1 corrinoid protein [Candidatus Atribacteria bacterium]HOQ50551.1 corrinoid protein [Candidatus Atribacteria bacterium]
MAEILDQIAKELFAGNAKAVAELTQKALSEGFSPQEILNEGMIKGMNEVGVKFKANEIYVPEVLIAARAMKAGMEILKPKLAETGVEPVGKMIIGTVKGDLHDIGKNLVAMMMEGAGFEVIDLGIDVPAEKFIQAIEEYQPQLVGMSALLTTTMIQIRENIKAFQEASIRDQVKVMIGGAPVTQKFADEVGADGYAPDAASAVDKAKELLGIS